MLNIEYLYNIQAKNIVIKIRFIIALLLFQPTLVLSANEYSGNFQLKYGSVDFHKTDTSIFNDDEAPNYKPFSLQSWIAKKYMSDTDIFILANIETYNPYGTETSSQFTADDTPDLSIEIDSGIIKDYGDYSVEIGAKFIRNRITSRKSDGFKRPYDYRRILGIYLNNTVNLGPNNIVMGTLGLAGNQKSYGRKMVDEIVYGKIFYNYKINEVINFKISHLAFRSTLKDKTTKPDESGHDLDKTSIGWTYDMQKYLIGVNFERYTIRYKIRSQVANGNTFFISLSIPFGDHNISQRHKLMVENKPSLGFLENMMSGPAE